MMGTGNALMMLREEYKELPQKDELISMEKGPGGWLLL